MRAALIELAEAAAPGPGVASLREGLGDMGVAVVAAPGGGYEVTVRVVAEPVPLTPMGDEVRARVEAAVAEAGLSGELASVTAEVVDIVELSPR